MEKLEFFLPTAAEAISSRINTNTARGFTPDEDEIELPQTAFLRIVLQAERKYQVTIEGDAWLIPDNKSSTPAVRVFTVEWSIAIKNTMKSSANPSASAVLSFRNPDNNRCMVYKLTMTRTP